MGTPISPEADEAQGYFSRERRRKLQDLSDYKNAGFVPPNGTVFDFGTVLFSSNSANALLLPANIEIVLSSIGSLPQKQFGIYDETDNITYFSSVGSIGGDFITFNHIFIKDHSIRIFRGLSASTNIQIFFKGPKSALNQIGRAQFT